MRIEQSKIPKNNPDRNDEIGQIFGVNLKSVMGREIANKLATDALSDLLKNRMAQSRKPKITYTSFSFWQN